MTWPVTATRTFVESKLMAQSPFEGLLCGAAGAA
jgi:hypothetical protein